MSDSDRLACALVAALALVQCRSHHGPNPTAAPAVAVGATQSAASRDSRRAPSRAAPAPATAVLRVVPLLDADKGRRAVAAYPRREAAPRALSSGSFTAPGADEVLLSVSTGLARAAGDHALALMRFSKGRYRLVETWLVANDIFSARLRLAIRGGRDALILCHQGGQQGLYRGSCGFFGQGGFAKQATTLDDNAADVPTGFVTACGAGRSVSLGSVSLRGNTVRFEVELERFVRSADQRQGEHAGGDYCSHVRTTERKRYAIDYRYAATGFRRSAPIPAAIHKALADNER